MRSTQEFLIEVETAAQALAEFVVEGALAPLGRWAYAIELPGVTNAESERFMDEVKLPDGVTWYDVGPCHEHGKPVRSFPVYGAGGGMRSMSLAYLIAGNAKLGGGVDMGIKGLKRLG